MPTCSLDSKAGTMLAKQRVLLPELQLLLQQWLESGEFEAKETFKGGPQDSWR